MYTKIFQNKCMSTKSILVFVFLMGFSSMSFASVYIAQTAQGTNDGSSCANARAASWFNTSGNWGSGATQINPGNIVYLCGSVSTNLTFQGSGATNSYITVDGTGATYTGRFNVTDKSWWRVQNVKWTGEQKDALIWITGGSNGIFTGNYADNASGDPLVWIGQQGGNTFPSNITISNNFLRTTAADLGNEQKDMIKSEGSTNVIVERNYLELRVGGAGSDAHNDIIQTYEKGGSSLGNPTNWTIRYNKFVMNSPATNDRSWTMLEMMGGTNNIYGNVFLGLNGASSANGLNAHNNRGGVVFNIFNNTFVSKNSASNNILNLSDTGTANIRNNIFYAGGVTALTGNMTKVRSNNLWYGSNIPPCSGFTGELCNKDPMFTDYTNNEFSLKSGSPAINTASNLGSPYNSYVVAGSLFPNPTLAQRPASGNWSIGAYDYIDGSTVTILPPTNLNTLP